MEIYLVRTGDSLAAIARSRGQSPEALAAINQLGDPRRLTPGLSLVLGDETRSALPAIELCAALSPRAEAGLIDELLPELSWLCVQSAEFTGQGELLMPEDEALLRAAERHRAMPLLSLSNLGPTGFSALLAHELLSREAAMEALTANILRALEARGYRGLDLSFQYLYAFERDAYSAFVRRLADALHAAGYYLFCSLAPKTAVLADSPICAAQDYAAIGAAADRVILLCHDWGGPGSAPQAIAPADRVAAVLDYAAGLLPPGKTLLSLSCGGCGWHLPWRQGDEARLLPARLAVDMAVSAGAEIRWDRASQAPFFVFDSEGRRRIVWYEDGRSISARLALAMGSGLAGVSLWPRDRLYRPGLRVLQSCCTGEKLS